MFWCLPKGIALAIGLQTITPFIFTSVKYELFNKIIMYKIHKFYVLYTQKWRFSYNTALPAGC